MGILNTLKTGFADSVGDDLAGGCTGQSTVARDETLKLVRLTHLIAGPIVSIGVGLAFPDPVVIVAAALYFAGMLLISLLLQRDSQVPAMAFIDLVVIATAASAGPRIWMALLVPAAASMTIGWLVSRASTWILWVTGVIAMAAAAIFADPAGAAVALLAFAASTASLNLNNLRILGASRRSVLRVADLVESLPVIVWESEVGVEALNRLIGRVEAVTGYSSDVWMGMSLEQRVHPDDLDRYRDDRRRAESVDGPRTTKIRLRRPDGSHVMVREVLQVVESGQARYLRGVTLDVAEEVEIRQAVDRLAAAVDHQSDPLVVLAKREAADEEPLILHMNPAFARLAGIDIDSAAEGDLWDVAPWLPRSVRADLDDLVITGRAADRDDLTLATPAGTRNFDYEIVALPDGSAAIQFTDVTDRKHAIELIRHQAFHDPLTALPNRTLLFDRLSQAIAASGRDGSSVGLLLLDLNQFKEINDTLGHAYGDQLLSAVGDRLAKMVRDNDTVARLGGDEFAMVVSGATEDQMTEIALRVGNEIRRTVELGGIAVEVSASIGGAVAPRHGDDPHALLQRADIAMYDAKRSGVPYKLYVPDSERHSLDRLTLMGELSKLLDGELRVWFQPKVDLRTGKAAGVESLTRWQHPRKGLLGPGQFLELCELSGLLSDLTFRVLDVTLEVMSNWPGQPVSINIPVRNLYDRTLPDAISERLAANGVAPELLSIEITESEIMEDHRTVVEVLEDLHERGIRISIDDFGTGFSSLTHLRRLPVHEIKIDRSFVSGMLDNENDYMIARSIIDLAHNLGHQVVAEGVEDTATLTLLRELGCDVGQGYLFSRPGPVERIRRQIEVGPALDPEGTLLWRNSPL